MTARLPKTVNICGVDYAVVYSKHPPFPPGEEGDETKLPLALIEYMERRITIYRGKRGPADLLSSLIHEIIHGIVMEMHLKWCEKNHEDLERLASCLSDTLIRNRLVRVG